MPSITRARRRAAPARPLRVHRLPVRRLPVGPLPVHPLGVRARGPSCGLLCALVLAGGCSGATAPGPAPLRQDGGAVDDGGPALDGGSTGAWAGLVLNEVAAAGSPDDWFELYNAGTVTLDLGGVGFTDSPTVAAPRARFAPGTTLAPGAYLVRTLTDADPGFKLGADEALVIFSPDGFELARADWAAGESPSGGSYARLPNATGPFQPTTAATRGAENRAGSADRCGDGRRTGAEVCDGDDLGGATCASEGLGDGALACAAGCARFEVAGCVAPMAGRVVVNEVSSSGDDRIELFNVGGRAVDLDGAYVVDAAYPGDPTNRYDLPPGTSLAPGGFLVLVKGTDHAFGLGGADAVRLHGRDDVLLDEVSWADGDALTSYCRVPDGAGAFARCTAATFGAPNTR
jgi:hypothetical protein